MRNKLNLNLALVMLMLAAFTGTAFAFGEDTRIKNEGAALKIKALQPIAATCTQIKNGIKQDVTDVKNYVSEKVEAAKTVVKSVNDTANDHKTQNLVKDEINNTVSSNKGQISAGIENMKQAIKAEKEIIKNTVNMQVTEAKKKINNNFIGPLKSNIDEVKASSGSAIETLLNKYLTRY